MTAVAPGRASTAAAKQPPGPPDPDLARSRLRAAVASGQIAYGVLRLRRAGSGWYHLVLGGRQLLQARLDAAGAFSPAADAAVDGIHVATMLGVALLRRRRRREALLGAAHALSWAVLDAALSRRPPPEPPARQEGRVRRTRA